MTQWDPSGVLIDNETGMGMVINSSVHLYNAASQSNALEELVEHKSRDEGPDGAGAVRRAQRDPDDDRVRHNAQLQHLWVQAKDDVSESNS